MILRKIFNPIAVLRYMWVELTVSSLLAGLVYYLYAQRNLEKFSLPFSIAAILGSALAIFLAFRNNNAYNRWWEARTIWGNILNNSRIFARQIIANANHAVAIGKASTAEAEAYKQELPTDKLPLHTPYAYICADSKIGKHYIHYCQRQNTKPFCKRQICPITSCTPKVSASKMACGRRSWALLTTSVWSLP